MSPRTLRTLIASGAVVLVAGIAWLVISGGSSRGPSSVHERALEQNAALATGTADFPSTAEASATTDTGAKDGTQGDAASDAPVSGSDGTAANQSTAVEMRLGLVVETRGGSSPVLVIDTVQLLPADETADPSSAEMLMFNDSKDLTSIPIAEDVEIESASGQRVSLKEWYASVAERFVTGHDVAVWVSISAGEAIRIEEQEL